MARDSSRRPTPRAKAKQPKVKQAKAKQPAAQRAAAPKRSVAARPAPKVARRTSAPAPKQKKKAPALGGAPSVGQLGKGVAGAAASAGSVVSGLASRLKKGSGPSAPSPREQRVRYQRAQIVRYVAMAVAGVLAVGLVVLIALFVLRDSPIFEITSVEVEPTQHVTVDDVSNLVQVPAGSTLLNVDTGALEESIKREPWVGSVGFERLFPNTLKITITEQVPDMLVVMSSGSVGWYLGTAGSWIEPTRIEAAEGQSVDDAALALAQSEGCLLVSGVPSTVDPEASAPATDAVLDAIEQFREGFSSDFASQIVRFSAPAPENISCTLASGVEVSLGAPTDIEEKEAIVSTYLEQHPNSLVSINVRVISSPAYREIASDNVQQGNGVSAGAEQGSEAEQSAESAETLEGDQGQEAPQEDEADAAE